MQDPIEQAKAEFIHAKDRLACCLSATPDDKLNWSPAPTARTPLQLAAHAAMAIAAIKSMLAGTPAEMGSLSEADRSFREAERKIETRHDVVELLEKNSAAYLAFLDALTPDRLTEMRKAPFGDASFPLVVALTFAASHTLGHAAQIDYIQTMYGDRDWHM